VVSDPSEPRPNTGANLHPLGRGNAKNPHAVPENDLGAAGERQTGSGNVLRLLEHVDLVTLNDAEARQLTEKANLVQAAQWIMARGPRHVIIKQGEHGAFMFTANSIFFAPAFPLENVFDPTGAGDSFAGGFIGYLAKTGDLSEANMRRAVIYGSVMGSFAVEKFSIERLMTVTRAEIDQRMRDMRRLVAFEEEIPA
jgi:sugar/nucleoside kinase (ribokinase family)